MHPIETGVLVGILLILLAVAFIHVVAAAIFQTIDVFKNWQLIRKIDRENNQKQNNKS
jgi:uncharacterized membrane protein YjfL (UPF0719 family)